jgi:hypothetical protein
VTTNFWIFLTVVAVLGVVLRLLRDAPAWAAAAILTGLGTVLAGLAAVVSVFR